MVAEGADRARPLARVAPVGAVDLAVEQPRIARNRAVRSDQRVARQALAAIGRDQRLALGHQRGREIEHHGVLAGARHADAERRGREAALGAAERRDQDAAMRVDEMDGDHALRGRQLGPVADPADMARVTQRHDRGAARARLGDADLHRLRRHGLAKAHAAIDHRHGVVLEHDLGRTAGENPTRGEHLDIARHAHHAVAVVPREIGGDEVARHARGLVGRTARGEEDARDEALERGDGNALRVGLGHGCPPGRRRRSRGGHANGFSTRGQ